MTNGQPFEVEFALLRADMKRVMEDVKEMRVSQTLAEERVDRAIEKALVAVRAEAQLYISSAMSAVTDLKGQVKWLMVTMVGVLATVAGGSLLLALNLATQ